MSPSSGRPRSVRRRSPRATVVAIASLAAAVVAVPSAAHAATAPTRFIGIGTNGERSDQLRPLAVSNDGTEILGTFGPYPVIRDVKAGVTHDILEEFDQVRGASADLGRIVFTTNRRLVPGDTNDFYDLYFWDRPSNTYSLVSKDREGKSLLTSPTQVINQIAISGLGTAVQFSLRDGEPFVDPDTDRSPVDYYRFEASRAYTQKFADSIGVTGGQQIWLLGTPPTIGDNGTTLLAGDKVIAPTATYTLKTPPRDAVVTSPNGQFVAWASGSFNEVTGIDTANGNLATVKYPSSLKTGGTLVGIANDASSVTLSSMIDLYKRFAFGHLDQRGGLRQIGGDIPITESLNSWSNVVLSRNEQFALTGLVLAKLGNTPLPGTEPTAPSNALATDYAYINELVCPSNYKGTPYRPRLEFTQYAQRSDLRLPVKATAKVWKDGSSTISNDFTIYPGQKKELYVGLKGGYRVDLTVTLSGGTVLTGSRHIDSHDQYQCIGL